ncbi:hypothetical protein [Aureicoccus marinus]|uniref:Viral A-type inclusion protein n=1 Tax=Aureicoccus marinus TaxID=754435 RepID=A0A2S7T905_9FLAO|nr:hypothetical protein [Aureicoccus marinus]PQJ16412.1 hypothetical protein BST99_12415 [Aureicoccus marinus]
MHSSPKFLTFCFLVLTLAFVFCKDDNKQKEGSQQEQVDDSSAQMKEVMAIHDEVMPKMSELNAMIVKLEAEVDSTTVRGQEAAAIVLELQDAYKSMMTWMKDFSQGFTTEEIMDGSELNEEKKQLLNQEEEKVRIVRDKINGSLEKAKSFLDS